MDAKAIIEFLTKVMPFNSLEPEDLKTISETLEMVSFPPHAIIITQGDPPGNFYLITSGLVRVYLTGANQQETVIGFLGEGDCFGEMSLLTQGPTTAHIQAVEPTRCLLQKQSDFYAMTQRHPAFLKYFSQLLSQRMKTVYKEILSKETGIKQVEPYLFTKQVRGMCSACMLVHEDAAIQEILRELTDRRVSRALSL